MGLTKTHQFTKEQNDLAELAKAMAHPARIAILQYLSKQNSCVCGSIVNEIGLAQATVSQHLKALKEAGLIQGTVEGATVCYCLNTDKIELAKQQLNALLNNCSSPNSCC
ncbi:MAG: winged helix-turn-helix transcriptional regulator [Flavobacteriales bacterium]|nr:winged helix-turn-helix transcriptional regulator [Flavobacteriales bacterium]